MSDLRTPKQRVKKFTKTAASTSSKIPTTATATATAATPTASTSTSTSTGVTVKTENGNKSSSSKSGPSKVVDSLIDTFYGNASTKYAAQLDLIKAEKGKLEEESLYLQVNLA